MQTSNQPDYLPPEYEYHQNDTLNEIKDAHIHNFIYVMFILVVFAGLMLWIMQTSVNAYFQQTYHKQSPLVVLDQYPAWAAGAHIGETLYVQHAGIKEAINTQNMHLIQMFNDDYAYTAHYQAYLAQKAQQEKQRLAAEAEQRVQQAIKSQFSLTKADQVFFAGDSLMQGVAPYVQKALLENYEIKTVNLSRQSTGLSYPRFFNWPETIKNTLADNPAIKVLVVFLGPNDPWDMANPEGGQYLKFKSPEWENLYRSRIAEIIQTAQQHGVSVMWISPPNMRKDTLNQQMIYLNYVIEDEVKKHKSLWIDSRPLLGGRNNVYADYIQKQGQQIKVRSADGIHFSAEGQKEIARHITENLHIVH